MKKIYVSFLLCFLIFFSISSAVEVRVNLGKFNMPEDPIIVNNRTLLPLRIISEVFDYDVKWDPKGIITLNNKKDTIVLALNSNKVIVNGRTSKLDAAPIIKGESTMAPIKFFEDYIEAKVKWYPDSKIVNIVIEDEETIARAETVSRSYEKRTKYPNARNKIIVVDAGHGGRETGATYGGIYEKDVNLKIAKYVEKELMKNGVRVYMTRKTDVTTPLSSRTNLANGLNADLFVSVHNNATLRNYEVRGTEVLYPSSNIIKNGITAKGLAQKLQDIVSKNAGTYNKGIINRNNLYVLNKTRMPAVIVEVAYMTNKSDLNKLKNEEFLQKAGIAIAEGIMQSF